MNIGITKDEFEIIARAIKTFGVKPQEDVAIEEMSELTKAIIKNRRYHTEETSENIREEMADVMIMLAQLIAVYGPPDEIITVKLERLKKRINSAECEINQHIEKCEDCGFCEVSEQKDKALKGLLCCAGYDNDGECTSCPYIDFNDGATCIKTMCRDVLKHIEVMQQKEVALKSRCQELENELKKITKTNN